MMTEQRNWEMFDKAAAMLNRQPFDRKTFNPDASVDKRSLDTLRTQGRSRLYAFNTYYSDRHDLPSHYRCCGSTALRNLNLTRAKRGDLFYDLGCGDSPDVLIAKKLGYQGFGC